MLKSPIRNVSLGMLVLMVTALSCNKNEEPAAKEPATEQKQATASDENTILDATAARVASPVPGYTVTYPYGIKDPRYAAGYHTGDDYAAPTGRPVVAVLGGTIAWSNNNGGAYGRWLGLRATNGRDYVYCHLSVRSVSTGATVVAGQKLGEVGATGNVTGPHLHFEDRPRGGGYGQVRKPTW
jgi:murein DD-endopeptidase MepM/ murein hydrolase activator NlpD